MAPSVRVAKGMHDHRVVTTGITASGNGAIAAKVVSTAEAQEAVIAMAHAAGTTARVDAILVIARSARRVQNGKTVVKIHALVLNVMTVGRVKTAVGGMIEVAALNAMIAQGSIATGPVQIGHREIAHAQIGRKATDRVSTAHKGIARALNAMIALVIVARAKMMPDPLLMMTQVIALITSHALHHALTIVARANPVSREAAMAVDVMADAVMVPRDSVIMSAVIVMGGANNEAINVVVRARRSPARNATRCGTKSFLVLMKAAPIAPPSR